MSAGRRRSLVVAVIITVSSGTGRTFAQDGEVRPVAAAVAAKDQHRDVELWALGGLDAAVNDRWSAAVRTGYAGGFDSAILQIDISYGPDPAKRLIVGHLLVNPTHAGSGAISILRAGGAWRPLSGRIELEHQGLVERLAADGRDLFRLRNRLRLTLGPAAQPPLRAFVSAEVFTVRESALNACRYQAGAMLSGRRVRIELYVVRQQFRAQSGFTALGASAIWIAGRRR